MLMLVFISTLYGQYKSTKNNLFDPSTLIKKPKGLLDTFLDPTRFSMSHSYTLTYQTLGKQGFSQGLYLNTMNYQFSDPLLMQLRIGYLHDPFGQNKGINNQSTLFLQRAMVQYKPYENMTLRVDYQALPSPLLIPYTISK